MGQDLDDPEVKRRTVGHLLVATPFLLVGSWLFAYLQGAEAYYATVIAILAAAGCLGTALSIHWFGSGSRHVLTAVSVIAALLAFLASR
mgnify:FL=1